MRVARASLIVRLLFPSPHRFIVVGLALKRQKERLPHGMFLPWIEAEFEMSDRVARRLMLRAERWSKLANLATLAGAASSTVLDELTEPETPATVVQNIEDMVVDGQRVTAADVRRLKAEARVAVETEAEAKAKVSELEASQSKEATKIATETLGADTACG